MKNPFIVKKHIFIPVNMFRIYRARLTTISRWCHISDGDSRKEGELEGSKQGRKRKERMGDGPISTY